MANCAHCGKSLGWAVVHCPYCGQPQNLKPAQSQAPETDWLARLLQDRSTAARQWAIGYLCQRYALPAEKAKRLVLAAVDEATAPAPGVALVNASEKPAPPLNAVELGVRSPAFRRSETSKEPAKAGTTSNYFPSLQALNSTALAPPLPASPDIHGWPAEHVQALQRQAAAALGLAVEFHDPLADGGAGPSMVLLPAGRFLAGSPGGEPKRRDNEAVPHPVSIERPFAIGQYAVAFEEYDCYAQAVGKALPADKGWGRGRRPVINVTWQDAQDYCAWLNQQTGQNYRLPAEAEWEYACRAGSTGPFCWGHSINPAQANYNSQYAYHGGPTGGYRAQTVAVEEFAANAFGLHQMHGNVFEWCQDICPDNCCIIPASPDNLSIPRIFRGGAYNFDPERLRSAARAGVFANVGSDILGFRLARDV